MAETRTIELNIVDNANQTQQQFENLRQQIAKTTQEVDELTQAYGENSQEVTEAKGRLNELTTSYTNLNKVATDTGATFADVYGEMQPLTTRMGEAEDRLYELALAGQTASKEYQDLLKATQNYLRVQQSVDLQVEAGAVPAAQKMTMAVGGVAGAFGVAEGAVALFGVESQKLQETMIRLQAALTITQSLASIKEAIPTFVNLGNKAKEALLGIRTGIAATGIGLLVVAVGTLVAYWDDIKMAVSGVSNEQQKYLKQLDKDITIQEHKGKMLDAQDNILKKQGKSEKEILQMKVKQIDGEIKLAESKLKTVKQTAKAELAAQERNLDYMKTYVRITLEGMGYVVRAIALPIDTVIAGANAVSKALGIGEVVTKNLNEYISEGMDAAAEWTAKLLFDPKETKAKSDATIRELELGLQQMKNDKAGFELEIQELGKQGAAASSSIAQGEVKEKLDLTRQRIDKEIELMEDGFAKEKRLLEEKAKREKEDLAESIKGKTYDQEEYAKTQKLIEDNLKKDLKALDAKYYGDTLKARGFSIETLKNDKIKEIEIEVQANQEKADNQKKFDEEEKERIKSLSEFRIKTAQDSLEIVSGLAELFAGKSEKSAKRAFQIQKAASIASALITTYQNATSAYASQFVPIPDPSSPIRGGIAAGIAVASGLLNVAKISKQKFEGGSTGGGGGGAGGGGSLSSPAPMTANFSTIGSSGINQLAQLQQTPTQAYVVSGEVTSAQALDRNRVQNATL